MCMDGWHLCHVFGRRCSSLCLLVSCSSYRKMLLVFYAANVQKVSMCIFLSSPKICFDLIWCFYPSLHVVDCLERHVPCASLGGIWQLKTLALMSERAIFDLGAPVEGKISLSNDDVCLLSVCLSHVFQLFCVNYSFMPKLVMLPVKSRLLFHN